MKPIASIKKGFFLCVLYFTLCLSTSLPSAAAAKNGSDSPRCQPPSPAQWNASAAYPEKKALVQNRLAQLKKSIADANASGIDSSKESISVHTAQLFLNFSDKDLQQQPKLKNIFSSWYRIKADAAADHAAKQPDSQLEQAFEIINKALLTLATACASPRARSTGLSPLEQHVRPEMKDGYYTRQGRRVFPWSVIWAPASASPHFSQFTSAYVDLSFLQNENTGILKAQQKNFEKKLDQQAANNRFLYLFLGHGRLPDWALKRHPEIKQGARHFTKYDIDHPEIRKWWNKVLSAYVPVFSRHPSSSNLYLIANEPHWFTAQNSWDTGSVSAYTHSKFQNWLKDKYQSITDLNQSWGANHNSFESVRFNVPVPNKLKSSASWYDWMRFNMDRSSEWFEFLCHTIKKYDPVAQCSIKVIAGTLSDPKFERDHGLDREKIINLQAVNGVDTKLETAGGIGGSQNLDGYAFHWQEMAFNFDFMKSLAPNAMIFDSEWHGFSNVHWRHLDMPENYIRSALWLSHLYGLGMTEAWYWGRQENGLIKNSNKKGFVGSLLTQPRMLNTYAQTMLEINNHAAEVEVIQDAARQINILYVEEAAIQTPDYIENIGKVHEAASFLGTAVAFTTANQLSASSASAMNNMKVLLIPAATHASLETLDAVQRFRDNGGQVIFIGQDVFSKNELNQNHDQKSLAKLKPVINIEMSNSRTIQKLLQTRLAEDLAEISCLDKDNNRSWGVICRTAKLAGKDILALVNVANQSEAVSIRDNSLVPESLFDSLSGEKLHGTINLEPMEIRLITLEN